MLFYTIQRAVLDFLFPICCTGCRKEKTHCCEKCLAEIPLIQSQTCPACGKPSPYGQFCNAECRGQFAFDGIMAASVYAEKTPLAELIHRFKYDFSEEIGGILAVLCKKLAADLKNMDCEFALTPVPLHVKRFNFRGFNQSEIIAEQLAKAWGVNIQNILRRHRWTEPQAELPRGRRLTNLRDAFSLKNVEERPNPAITYLLVDDVATTGSTLNECAKALRQRGAGKVLGLVIAKA